MASRQMFVRSKDEIAPYEESRQPTGHRLTAWEALKAYGIEVLEEAVERGSAILRVEPGAAATALKARREALGLPRRRVARATGLDEAIVAKAEAPAQEASIHDMERIAISLGLDERLLSFDVAAGADDQLGIRLKTLQAQKQSDSAVRLGEGTVTLFAEAAAIIAIQHRLQEWLDLRPAKLFEPSDDYGDAETPAWKIGYELAARARAALGLDDAPIASMRDLVEKTLRIPVLQAELPSRISGATVSSKSSRGLILNVSGDNENVWVRRATLAHELGHLLFDPESSLTSLRVDTYEEAERDPQSRPNRFSDYVEQRANAFAIAFLAPPSAVRELVGTPPRVDARTVSMRTFGISFTAASYHVTNSLYGQYEIPTSPEDAWPSDEQRAGEDFTIDYFQPETTPLLRRGRFARLVVAAYDERMISDDTAAEYLRWSQADVERSADFIRSAFPEV